MACENERRVHPPPRLRVYPRYPEFGTLPVKVQRPVKQGSIHRNHPDIGRGVAAFDKLDDFHSKGVGQGIAHLREYGFCHPDLVGRAPPWVQDLGWSVILVTNIQQRLHIRRIEKELLRAQEVARSSLLGVP